MKNPYPAAPQYNPITCVYITNTENGRTLIQPWAALFPVKKIIEKLSELTSSELKQTANDFASLGPLTIKCAELNDILEHEYTTEERDWLLDNQEMRKLLQLSGRKPEPKAPKSDEPKAEKPPREPKREATPDGFILLKDICAELGIEPKDARIKLRAAKEPNTRGNWSFDPAEVDRIKKIIKV